MKNNMQKQNINRLSLRPGDNALWTQCSMIHFGIFTIFPSSFTSQKKKKNKQRRIAFDSTTYGASKYAYKYTFIFNLTLYDSIPFYQFKRNTHTQRESEKPKIDFILSVLRNEKEEVDDEKKIALKIPTNRDYIVHTKSQPRQRRKRATSF